MFFQKRPLAGCFLLFAIRNLFLWYNVLKDALKMYTGQVPVSSQGLHWVAALSDGCDFFGHKMTQKVKTIREKNSFLTTHLPHNVLGLMSRMKYTT